MERFTGSFTQQEPIPEEAIAAALYGPQVIGLPALPEQVIQRLR